MANSVIRKDLGAVSAYAVAVKNGFVGTEAEWEAYIANASIKAAEAASSSDAAHISEQNAERAAEEAIEAASTISRFIDDTAGSGVTDRAWSANKLVNEFSSKSQKNNPVFTGSISMGRASGTTVGTNSVAVGNNVNAAGNHAHAEGSGTKALGSQSHAEGINTIASSTASHAEGSGSYASDANAHAEGNSTVAAGEASHAEGYSTIASGNAAHAEGTSSEASGKNAHAEGLSTKANHASQHVFGEYNVADPSSANAANRGTYIEVVGNGANNGSRSNARVLDWNGNERLKGDLYVGCYGDSSGGTKVAKITDVPDVSGKLDSSLKGAANGLAELDAGGKVPSSQLPSYVDDVEEYASLNLFPSTGEAGKIYVALNTNVTYRWGGSSYIAIGSDLALGETSSTAYRGDRGKAAYDAAVVNPDSTPTQNSDHLVKSGGVYSAVAAKYTKPPTGIPASDMANGVLPVAMTGATSSVAGTSGLVPAPAAGDDEKVLMGDGTWHTLPPSGSSDIITVTGTVTNVSGAYSGTISNANVTEDMMPVRVVIGNRAAFLDEDLQVTCNNGSVSLACSSVSGTSTITIYVFGSQDTSLMQAWSGGDY